jgi:hypothetical protein
MRWWLWLNWSVHGENPTASDGEDHLASPDAEDALSEGGSGNENSLTYYFRSSTITVGKIKEMVEKGYFLEGGASTPRDEIMPEPDNDEAQLLQLMPNAIAQLSKYFWAVGSFRGVPSRNGFVRRYELHYQSKTIETLEGDQITQYGCLNFHAKRDGSLKLSLTIQNKWSSGWTKLWFYCRVPCRQSSEGGKSVHALHS